MDKQTINEMTGEKDYKKAPDFKLNQVNFNGKDGKFVKLHLLEEKLENGKYKKTDLGESLDVVFLKHRRDLSSFKKVAGENVIKQTNEHNHKDDFVTLFMGANKESGIASDLRVRYPELKTRQIVYVYVPQLDEVVRLFIKGSSLGSNQKEKEVMGYYEYLGSFGSDESCWQYETNLTPVQETSDLGDYYAISFNRGKKLDEKEIETTMVRIEAIHNKLKDIDDYYKSKKADVREEQVSEEPDVVDDYPTEDINPDDIPF